MGNTKIIAKNSELLDLLRSSDFTLVYHDNGSYELFHERYDNYDDIDYDNVKPVHCGDQYLSEGYIPTEVDILVKALGGKVVTI